MKVNVAFCGLAYMVLVLALQAPALAIFIDRPAYDGRVAVQPDEGDLVRPTPPQAPENPEPLPQIERDLSALPPVVRRLREQIIAAATTGDVEKLKAIFEMNGGPPQLSCEGVDDTIDCLRSLSGDPEGRELLANLISVLDAGYVHVAAGTPDEMYVWPYFAVYPLERLTPPHLVELFKLLTAADVEDMKSYGTYLFYRVGIAPDGTWQYFITGQ